MDLEKELFHDIDLCLLKTISSPIVASKLINKFERYSGKIPTEMEFYNAYLKYAECKEKYGRLFDSQGKIYPVFSSCFNLSIKLGGHLVKVLENYLFCKKIIGDKIF